MVAEPSLRAFNRLVGTWTTEATHPALPGIVVHGTAIVDWLEGERFLIHRARTDHPDFPHSISIIGFTDRDRAGKAPPRAAGESELHMHYFDSRGVFRVYNVRIDDESWRIWRVARGFSQRFTGTLADAGNTIVGRWQMSEDDIHWKDDLQISYWRRS